MHAVLEKKGGMQLFLDIREDLPLMRKRQFQGLEQLEARRLLAVSIDNLPATNITLDSATVGVDVIEYGRFKPSISLFWGLTDGGTDFGAWENREQMGILELGNHEVTLTRLDIGTNYFYRTSAFSFDGEGWSPQTASFSTLAPQPPILSPQPAIVFAGGTNARVSGSVEETGGETPTVTVYFGTQDGGEQPNEWEASLDLGENQEAFRADIISLIPNQQYFVRYAATNSGGTSWSAAESFSTQSAPPLIINEISAAAPTMLEDEPFGTRIRSAAEKNFLGDPIVYDWIEIANNTNQEIDLSGYSITDDADEVTKWTFPDGAIIPPLNNMVLFASGLDIANPELDEHGAYHTNFRLSSNAAYLGLFNTSATLVDQENYPDQITNVSYGYFGDRFEFMAEPTPGVPNVPGKSGIAETPQITQPSQSFTEDFLVEISTDAEGHEIRFTLDGSIPDENSALYDGPISVSDSLQIRARAYHENRVASQIAGESYLKISQDAIDFRSHLPIVVVENFDGTRPSERQTDAFLAIFDVSTETGESSLLDTPHVASRIGIKVRGQSSSGDTKTPYRVETRDQHDRDLDVAPLGLPAESDWVLHGPWSDRTLVHNTISYELGSEVGLVTPRTRYVELFRNLNGGAIRENDYLGLYLLVENIKRSPNRLDIPDLDPGQLDPEEITGGYILRFEQEVSEGPDRLSRWRHLELLDGHKYSPEQKAWITQYINRTDLAITRANVNRDFEQFIDVDSFVNSLVMHELGRDQDAYVRSYYLYKDRGGKLVAGPLWDFNLIWNRGCCFDNRNPRGWQFDQDRPGRNDGWNKGQHNWNGQLMESWDFSQRFIDRWTHLRQPGNPLSLDSLMSRVDRHVTEIGEAATRNFQRFRNHLSNTAGFPGPRFPTYQQHIDDMKEWITKRVDWIDSQFRTSPQIEELNGSFRMTGGNGTIYYTLDGSDPFSPMTGQPADNAIAYDGSVIPAADGTQVTARLYDPTVAPRRTELTKTQWSAPASSIISTAVAANSQNLKITELNYHPHEAMTQFGELDADDDEFEFVEVRNVSSQMIDLSEVRFVEVGQGHETEGILFHFAPQILQPNESRIIVSNRQAFYSRHPNVDAFASGNDGAGGVDGQYSGRLSNGGELLTLLDAQGEVIQAFAYGDANDWPSRADGIGSSLELIDVTVDPNAATNWRASQFFEGSPGVDSPQIITNVVINEILSNSDEPAVDQLELFNVGDTQIDVQGWLITGNRRDLFRHHIVGDDTLLAANSYLVLDQNRLGFGFKGQSNDDAWLIATDGNGKPLRFADQIEFGPTDVDTSLGRWPNGTGQVIPMRSTTFGNVNSGPALDASGDLNGDGSTNVDDIHRFCEIIQQANPDLNADFNSDRVVDLDDLKILVEDYLQSKIGDADLNGEFNSSDFVHVFRAGKYEDTIDGNANWSEGDWNCDGDFTSRDLVFAFQSGSYTAASKASETAIAASLMRHWQADEFVENEKIELLKSRQHPSDDPKPAIDTLFSTPNDEIFEFDEFSEIWNASNRLKETVSSESFLEDFGRLRVII